MKTVLLIILFSRAASLDSYNFMLKVVRPQDLAKTLLENGHTLYKSVMTSNVLLCGL